MFPIGVDNPEQSVESLHSLQLNLLKGKPSKTVKNIRYIFSIFWYDRGEVNR